MKYYSLPVEIRPKLEDSDGVLRMADGGLVKVEGKTTLPLHIEGRTYYQEVIVADVEAPLVMGYDFMLKNSCNINIGEGICSIGNYEVKCMLESEMPSVFKIALTKTVIIPPLTEIITTGKFTGHKPHFTHGMVEPASEKLVEKGVLVGKVLVDSTTDIIPMRIMNISDSPQIIRANQVAGSCYPVAIENNKPGAENTLNVNKISETTLESMTLPPHLECIFEECKATLDNEQLMKVKALLLKHQSVFSKTKSDLGYVDVIQHRINTGLAPPIKQAPHKVPLTQRDEVNQEIDRMLDMGIIEPSASPWAAPIVPVRKPDGSIRICSDMRKLNTVILKDQYPLPRIQDCLDSLKGAKYFSTLDATSGFFQLSIHPDDMDKTAITCHKGQFRYTVLPMGLANAPATYQRLMEFVMAGLQYETLLVYMDDCIVHADNFEEHINRLDEALARFKSINLKLSPRKCHLFRLETKFLGHVVSEKGISTNKDKIAAIKDWPVPTNEKEVKSFVSLCSYYRRFVNGFAKIAAPLHKLTQKQEKFVWTQECQQAFETLKQALITSPTLAYPNTHDPYILDCDASSFAIGSVLSQIQNGIEKPIAYYSRVLHKTERNWCVTRRELFSIVESVTHFHQYLYGLPFTVRTDHSALQWLLQFKSPSGQLSRWLDTLSVYDFKIKHRSGSAHQNADGLSRRPCSSCTHCERREKEDNELGENEEHTCRVTTRSQKSTGTRTSDIEQRKLPTYCGLKERTECGGIGNLDPSKHYAETATDRITENDENLDSSLIGVKVRNPRARDNHLVDGESEIELQIHTGGSEDSMITLPEILGEQPNATNPENVNDMENMKEAQIKDPVLGHLYEWKSENNKPKLKDIEHHSINVKQYWHKWNRISMDNGILVMNVADIGKKIVLPQCMKEEILSQLHDNPLAGHLGITRTRKRVKARFYWINMNTDVDNWIRKCKACQARKIPQTKYQADMQPIIADQPFELVSLDIVGPLPETHDGNKYCLTVTDHFTRWTEVYPLKKTTAETVADKFVSEFISRYGLVQRLLTDQGKQFESKLFKKMCELLKIKKIRCSAFHPQCNGKTERFNRTMEDMLSKYISPSQKDWDIYLPLLVSAYNTSTHESTKQTPYNMLFGRESSLPIDLQYETRDTANTSGSDYVSQLREQLNKTHDIARQEMLKSSEKQKKKHDSRSNIQRYEVGDNVWLRNKNKTKGLSPKLQFKYIGPYIITEKRSEILYRVQKINPISGPKKMVHHNRLKPYH